ncbi:hypothetical protein A7A76_02855 [Lysobacter enzymogenes]|uniref:glycosyltransferase n=1 Tax=Lysobacter enzymogenes TaxID=69 RepID=UPI0019CFEF43|nr:glycosyltransferase [Lysobacter enzymogenes]MBN7138023.1 hypothetical protein [Lysobacter enzymogenes]
MRITIDLQACQTESRFRGIGRYAMGLTKALLAGRREQDEYLLGVDKTYPATIGDIHRELEPVGGYAGLLGYAYPGPTRAHGPEDTLRPAAEALIRQRYSAVSSDLIHVNSLFEGYIEHAGGLGQLAQMPGTVSSVTLYDLIPELFPQLYLSNADQRWWYRRKLLDLCQFDVILCISEATKADAIRLLGIPEEKLAVIYAGVDEHFFEAPAADQGAAVRHQFGIRDRFVLYTGNGDVRKNLRGAVESFAAVPKAQRRSVQLVLNQVGDERAVRQAAAQAGLSAEDVVITGRISDRALKQLFRACDVFFFPSLYEGFGLPVLEAMACGAPAIAGDNSSLPEVVGRKDALFDASSVADSAQCLARVLGDEGLRASLRETGPQRAREFTWERTAQLTREAWGQAVERRARRDATVPVERRLKVALVTPMRPEQTGIADYIAELLPALTMRMDVDIYTSAELSAVSDQASAGRVLSWRSLPANAANYDQVIYQFGNSPFHAHMVELLDQVPGMVVLHDFFLSSMLSNMDEIGATSGLFPQELERSHGRGAVALLDRDGVLDARRAFPASRRIVERADAVVVHSTHAIEMAQRFFPGVGRGPLLRAAMPQIARPAQSDSERARAREALGIGADEILVVTFGFIADTKLNLETLQALADPRLAGRADLRFAFVGGMPGDDYGRAINEAIAAHPLRARILITDFVSAEKYELYQRAADIAIQLRQHSRGETSKSVLDCMSHGVAVIVNDYGSFAELPDTAVAKVAARVEPARIADRLAAWLADPAQRRAQAEAGRAYVAHAHSPFAVAGQYERAVALSMRSRRERAGKELARRLTDAFALGGGAVESEFQAVRHALERFPEDAPPRVFVDLSEVVNVDHGTGVHRVVRNLARELSLGEGERYRCVPTTVDEQGQLIPVDADYLQSKLGVRGMAANGELAPELGDAYFLLDSAWERPERFTASIERVHANGGRVYALVHDLIPLRFPQYCVDFMPRVFEQWLRYVVAHCDGLICVSRATADDLRVWIRQTKAQHRPGLRIGHAHLGGEIDEGRAGSGEEVSPAMREAMSGERQAVLMVGTLEPRKRHDLALDAFDRLWAHGDPRHLVIIGKKGWNVDALAQRIASHPQYGKRLFWLQGVSDADLSYAYTRAERVVQASDAEGFGLPLIEAARYHCPLLLSDISVFREIAGDKASYFPAGDAAALAQRLREPADASTGSLSWTTGWRDTAQRMLALMRSGGWDHELP